MNFSTIYIYIYRSFQVRTSVPSVFFRVPACPATGRPATACRPTGLCSPSPGAPSHAGGTSIAGRRRPESARIRPMNSVFSRYCSSAAFLQIPASSGRRWRCRRHGKVRDGEGDKAQWADTRSPARRWPDTRRTRRIRTCPDVRT